MHFIWWYMCRGVIEPQVNPHQYRLRIYEYHYQGCMIRLRIFNFFFNTHQCVWLTVRCFKLIRNKILFNGSSFFFHLYDSVFFWSRSKLISMEYRKKDAIWEYRFLFNISCLNVKRRAVLLLFLFKFYITQNFFELKPV